MNHSDGDDEGHGARISPLPREVDPLTSRSRVPLGVQVADQLRAYIRERGLVDGDLLPSEAKLAEEFGISQRVVRDALRTLSNQGVVQTRQGKRARIGELRPVAVKDYFRVAAESEGDAVHELLELRLLLEPKAAELAAERATEEDLATLRERMVEMSAPDLDLRQRVAVDLAFHNTITRASGNRFFQAILDALSEALADERQRGGELTESAGLTSHAETNAHHQALLSALEQRDGELAAQRMRVILSRAQDYFRASQVPDEASRTREERPS
jgi:GntR family transcriptional regulator, transcriptional repressor for pyruvate dehydrogenase complex